MIINGNTILITGGATGIGFSLAKKFVELGNNVLICGRRENRLQEAKEKVPALHYKMCDIANSGQRNELFNWVKNEFPGLNMLINNGAYQNDYSLTEGLDALEGAADEIAAILTAPIMMNAMFTDFLKDKENATIVNVTSILGFVPMARIPVYCAAKAGCHTYTLLQRKQYANAGIKIKIFEAAPPHVESELNIEGRKKAGYASGPKGLDPDVYAAFVIDGIRDDVLDIFYGQEGQDAMYLPRIEFERRRLI